MAENIVPIFREKKPDPKVLSCGNCSCQHLYIEATGRVQCRSCEEYSTLKWFDPTGEEEYDEH